MELNTTFAASCKVAKMRSSHQFKLGPNMQLMYVLLAACYFGKSLTKKKMNHEVNRVPFLLCM